VASLQINITNFDEPLEWDYGNTPTTLSINENFTGSTGHRYLAVDPESETITYQIHLGIGFSIDSSGLLSVSNALDYESATQRQITIKASTSGHVIYQNLTINVINDTSDDGPTADVSSNSTYFNFSLLTSDSVTMIFYFTPGGNRDNWDRVFQVRSGTYTNLNTNDPIFEYRSRFAGNQEGDFNWPDREKTGGSAQFNNGSLSFDTNGVKYAYVVKTGENIGMDVARYHKTNSTSLSRYQFMSYTNKWLNINHTANYYNVHINGASSSDPGSSFTYRGTHIYYDYLSESEVQAALLASGKL